MGIDAQRKELRRMILSGNQNTRAFLILMYKVYNGGRRVFKGNKTVNSCVSAGIK